MYPYRGVRLGEPQAEESLDPNCLAPRPQTMRRKNDRRLVA